VSGARGSAISLALLALALAAPLALRRTVFQVVPTLDGAWRGWADPPGAAGVALALILGGAVALALRDLPPGARRPLLAFGVAMAPLLTIGTGRWPAWLALQGPMLVVVGAAALAVALERSGTLAHIATRLPCRPRALEATLFASAFLTYAAFGLRVPGPAGPQGDEPHYLTMAQSLLSDGDLDLADEFAGREYQTFFAGTLEAHTSPASPRGRIYTVHAPGLAALVLPAYALGGYPAVRLFLSVLAALTALLTHRLVRDVTGSGGLALAGWALIALTPPLPIYAVAVYPETPAALATAGLLLTMRRDPGRGMLAAATTAAATLPWLHPKFLPLAVVGLGITLARRGPRAARLVALAAFAGSMAALLAFFKLVYGVTSLSAAYGPGFGEDVGLTRLPWGLLALACDRQFGVLSIASAFVLVVPGAFALAGTRAGDVWRAALLAGATLGVGASFSMWWGGACPPARFVVPALPALVLVASPALARWRGTAAALAGAGLAVLALAADAPRALHNRGDGESGLLRFLAPGVNLDASLPSFVLGGVTPLLLTATLAAGLALAWRFAWRGAAVGAAAYLLVAGEVRDTPLVDSRRAALRALESWDATNTGGPLGPLDPTRVPVDLDLRATPWRLAEGDRLTSRWLSLPAGRYRVEITGRSEGVAEGIKTTRLDVFSGPELVERVYLEAGRSLAFPLALPNGARRLQLLAVGVQGVGVIEGVRLLPEVLGPRGPR
jgi:hypothetical protein